MECHEAIMMPFQRGRQRRLRMEKAAYPVKDIDRLQKTAESRIEWLAKGNRGDRLSRRSTSAHLVVGGATSRGKTAVATVYYCPILFDILGMIDIGCTGGQATEH